MLFDLSDAYFHRYVLLVEYKNCLPSRPLQHFIERGNLEFGDYSFGILQV